MSGLGAYVHNGDCGFESYLEIRGEFFRLRTEYGNRTDGFWSVTDWLVTDHLQWRYRYALCMCSVFTDRSTFLMYQIVKFLIYKTLKTRVKLKCSLFSLSLILSLSLNSRAVLSFSLLWTLSSYTLTLLVSSLNSIATSLNLNPSPNFPSKLRRKKMGVVVAALISHQILVGYYRNNIEPTDVIGKT